MYIGHSSIVNIPLFGHFHYLIFSLVSILAIIVAWEAYNSRIGYRKLVLLSLVRTQVILRLF